MCDDQGLIARYQQEDPFAPMHKIVYKILRDDIISCRLAPGEKLKEEDHAARFGISRTTVRHAFEALLYEDWLEREGKQGLRVCSISTEDQRELMELRQVLEPAASRLAARNRTRQDLEDLAGFLACDTASGDVSALYYADIGFHRAIFDASHNGHFVKTYRALDDELSRSKRFSSGEFLAFAEQVCAEHRAIFEAIRGGDENRAQKLSQLHVKMMLDCGLLQK